MEAATSHFQLSEDEHRKQRFRAAMRHNLTAYAFLAPILVFFFVFMALPVVWLFYLSFQHDGILAPAQFAGLDNWRRTFSDGLVLKCIGNTLYYCAMAIPTVFVLGMIVALSLSVVRRGAAILRIIIYFPTLQASLIVALIWTFVIHPDFGLLNLGIRALTGVKAQLPRRSPFRHADHRDDRGLEGSRILGDTFPLRTACAPRATSITPPSWTEQDRSAAFSASLCR